MSEFKKRAAILPLEYGRRTEHAITYFCPDWEELLRILEHPAEALTDELAKYWDSPEIKGRMKAKGQEDAGRPWLLNPPITAVLTSARESAEAQETLLRLACPKATDFVTAFMQDLKASDPFGVLDLITWDSNLVSATQRFAESEGFASVSSLLDNKFEDGAFYLHFALDTSTLLIYYYRPLKERAKMWYEGSLHESTLALNKDTNKGTLHFDLEDGRCDRFNRARIIMDIIEHPHRVADLVMRDGLKHSVPSLVDADEEHPKPLGWLISEAPDVEFYTLPDRHQMVVEGLSSETENCVCVWVCVTNPDGSKTCRWEAPCVKGYVQPGSGGSNGKVADKELKPITVG